MKDSVQHDLIPINVWLSGRSYRIRVPAAEEGTVRRAVKKADEKISELRLHYAGRDDQDFLAMCLIMYATDPATGKGSEAAEEDIAAILKRMDSALDKE